MPARSVLVHYHIFKNAGTSVDAVLESSFGNRWVAFEGAHAHDVQSSQQLERYLRAHSSVIAVSSHLARPPLPWPDCRAIVFLRHPILRARSVYEHVRRDVTASSWNIAQSGDFGDYVAWALDGGKGGIVLRDYQVVHLSDASFRTGNILDPRVRATPDDLRQAKALIESWDIVGIVEHFDKSAARFQTRYGDAFPGLNFAPAWLNRTRDALPVVDRDVSNIRRELGDELFERLLETNQLDLDLWRFGTELL